MSDREANRRHVWISPFFVMLVASAFVLGKGQTWSEEDHVNREAVIMAIDGAVPGVD